MKPTFEEILAAVKGMGGIPYFPADDPSREMIAGALGKFVETEAGLKFTIREAVSKMRRWDQGVPELRGIYCAGGFTPLDGIYEQCTTPNVLPDEALPAYYQHAPKLLRPPEPSEEEKAEFKKWAAELEEKLKQKREREGKRRLLWEAQHKDEKYEPPDWMN